MKWIQYIFIVFIVLAIPVGPGTLLGGDGIDQWDFQYDILPVLVKSGCSSAECHGGATGRGGFKLSLFGTDPLNDYDAIVRDSFGRRINLHSAGDSLILGKPTRKVPHEGGRIFNKDSSEFQTLYNWIKAGAPYLDGRKQQLNRVSLTIDIHNIDRLKLTGHFSALDGSSYLEKDLTHHADFRSTDESVIQINNSGFFENIRPGEAYITAQFLNFSDRFPFKFPFGDSEEFPISDKEFQHPLDQIWHQYLDELRLEIPKLVPWWRYNRRLHLTVAGRPPTKYEMDSLKLESSAGPEYLHGIIDKAMEYPGFQRKWSRWALQWLELESISQPVARRDQLNRLAMRVEAAIQEDESLKELAETVLGKERDIGFLRRFSDPRDRSEYVARSLLGIRIGCARCHNHPDDRWSRVDHLKFSAAFSNSALEMAGRKNFKPHRDSLEWDSSNYSEPDMELPGMSAPVAMMGQTETEGDRLFLPGTKHAISPGYLSLSDGINEPIRSAEQTTLYEWFSSSATTTFARNMANRIFHELTGVALVSPVDDHRKTNPARYEQMLDHLAGKLEDLNFQLKPFIRYVVSSRMFRMEGMDDADKHTQAESRYLTRWVPLALDNEAWTDALGGMLGIQIQPPERSDNPLSLQLALLNSDWLSKVLSTPGNQFEAMNIFFTGSDRQRLQELHQLALTRPLTDSEVSALLIKLSQSNGSVSPQSWEHFFKAMVMSPEFCFIR